MAKETSNNNESKLKTLFDSKPLMVAATIAVVAISGSYGYNIYENGGFSSKSTQLAMAGCKSIIANNLRRRQVSAYDQEDFKNVYQDIVGNGSSTSMANQYLEIGFSLNDNGMVERVAVAEYQGTDAAGYPIIERVYFNCHNKAQLADFKSNYLWTTLQPSDWKNPKAWVQKASNEIGLKNQDIQEKRMLARNRVREPLDNKIELFYPQYNLSSPKERNEIKRSLIRVLADNYYVQLPIYIDDSELSNTLNKFAYRLNQINDEDVKKISHNLNVHIALYKGDNDLTEEEQEDELMQLASLSDFEYQNRQRAQNFAGGVVASIGASNKNSQKEQLRAADLVKSFKKLKHVLSKKEMEFVKGPNISEMDSRFSSLFNAVKTMLRQERRNELLFNVNLEDSQYHKAYMDFINSLDEQAKIIVLGQSAEDSIISMKVIKNFILTMGDEEISNLNENDTAIFKSVFTGQDIDLSLNKEIEITAPQLPIQDQTANMVEEIEEPEIINSPTKVSFSYLQKEKEKLIRANKIASGNVASLGNRQEQLDISKSTFKNEIPNSNLFTKYHNLKYVLNEEETAMIKGNDINETAKRISKYIEALKAFKNGHERNKILKNLDVNDVSYRRALSSYVKSLDRNVRKQIMGRSIEDLRISFNIMDRMIMVIGDREIASIENSEMYQLANILNKK